MTKTQTTRNEIIDIAKGIAIYLVVLGHLQLTSFNTSILLIASCHMPVFFFLSGIFFLKSYDKYTTKEFILNKVRTLIIPYLIWSFVAFAENVVLLILNGNDRYVINEAYDIFVNSRSVWFLVVLFLTNIYIYILFYLTKKNKIWSVILAIVFWVFSLFMGKISILSLYKFQWLLPYFLLGIIMSYDNKIFDYLGKITNRNIIKQTIITIICVTVYIASDLLMCDENLFDEFYSSFNLSRNHIIYYIFLYLIGMVGIVTIIEVAAIMIHISKASSYFRSFGFYSIDIYVIHMFLVVVIEKVISLSFVPMWAKGEIALLIYAFLVVLVITLIVDKCLRRIRLYRVAVGGR